MNSMNDENARKFKLLIESVCHLVNEVPIPMLAECMSEEAAGNQVKKCLAQQEAWASFIANIATDMKARIRLFRGIVEKLNGLTVQLSTVTTRLDHIDTIKLRELLQLCDQLERHSKTGILNVVLTIGEPK